ncbi:MAG: Gfo/Idh/MocA family oxidoreductase [candidate division Zixibacteria bacterium]|nr:Gfo/Idh/MocA family oxidoreductase [candidate division Zixibacteria bacterium]
MSDLHIGVVGLGWVAGAHIETFKSVSGASVTAICSRRSHSETDLKARYGLPLKAYTDYRAMLADPDIHAIDICTPHPFHADQAVAAAEAGKHLIIEKPIALSYADTLRIRDAVRRAGVQVCVCFECRYSAHFTLIRSVIDEGFLGDLHYAEVDYYHGIGPWYGQYVWNIKKDFGGSSLLTAGCHALDGLLFFMDGKVEEVVSYRTRSSNAHFAPYEYDTTSVSLLKFEGGGKIAKVTSCIDCMQPYYFHIHLVGSKGSLLDNRIYSEKLKGLVKTKWSELETAPIDSGDVKDHPYLPQFQAFTDSVSKGAAMPLTDLDTALETHRVAFAADRSADEGRTVKVSEMDKGQ